MALDLANSEIPSHQYSDFRTLQTNAIKSLKKALDAFARLDIEVALRVIEDDEMIDHGKRFSRAAPNVEFKLIEEET